MNTRNLFLLIAAFAIASVVLGCHSKKHYSKTIIDPVLMTEQVTDEQGEIDDIFTLLIYALVYNDWQSDQVPRNKRRGYNIGALIVDAQNQPVRFDLNCINSTDNATQHGEVRAITSYLEETRIFNLSGHTIYTTLEPCVMCAGMMTMTAVKRVIYGQADVEYSKAFERLAIDTRAINGFPPYPRRVIAEASAITFRQELDAAYQSFLNREEEKILARFLASQEAKAIYERAFNAFINYEVKLEENQAVYQAARSFFDAAKYPKPAQRE